MTKTKRNLLFKTVAQIPLMVFYFGTNVPSQVFQGWFWPFVGFLFLPFATLSYLIAHAYFSDYTWAMSIIMLIGFLTDLLFSWIMDTWSKRLPPMQTVLDRTAGGDD